MYKLKTIYIQIANDLYIYRKQFVYRSLSSLPKVIFRLEKVRILNFSTSMSTSFHLLIWNHPKLLFVVENFFGTCFNLSSICLCSSFVFIEKSVLMFRPKQLERGMVLPENDIADCIVQVRRKT